MSTAAVSLSAAAAVVDAATVVAAAATTAAAAAAAAAITMRMRASHNVNLVRFCQQEIFKTTCTKEGR